jgi:hypothetical protein
VAAKLCLRCDWTGRTTSISCPRCGAPLYDGADRERQGSSPERSWRGWIATGLVLVLAALAFVTIQRFIPAAAPSRASTTGLQGYLVYPAPDAELVRLWIWDLAAGTVQPGPVVGATPSALVSTYSVQDSWVGLTMPTGSGASEVAVLRGADPGAVPVPLASGDIVAWQEGGAFVSVLRSGPRTGCRSRLVVTTVSLVDRISGRSFDRTVCGRSTGLLRDSTSPYVTLRTAHDVTVSRVAADTLSPVLRGYSALGITLNGDFLVRAPGGQIGMYYPGPGVPRPAMITLHGQPLSATRVLAWSTDGNVAYVLGAIGGVHGVFALTVGPRPVPGTPTLVLGTSSTSVVASITVTNDLYVLSEGSVRFVHEGQVTSVLSLPRGAPEPAGPLLWVLSLPYSPSVTP